MRLHTSIFIPFSYFRIPVLKRVAAVMCNFGKFLVYSYFTSLFTSLYRRAEQLGGLEFIAWLPLAYKFRGAHLL